MTNPGVTPSPQHGQAVDIRQPEIEDNGVVLLGLAEEIGALTIARTVHGIAGVAKRAGQLLRE